MHGALNEPETADAGATLPFLGFRMACPHHPATKCFALEAVSASFLFYVQPAMFNAVCVGRTIRLLCPLKKAQFEGDSVYCMGMLS